MRLPPQSGIDHEALTKTLDDKATSYKFLWLLALLEILRGRDYDPGPPIAFGELCAAMLKRAQPLIERFNLSLGSSDEMHLHIKALGPHGRVDDFFSPKGTTPNHPAFQHIVGKLCTYVPYRWARPFVKNEIKGPGKVNKGIIRKRIIAALAKKFRGETPPPYSISLQDSHIWVHPLWAEYFQHNADIIESWCLWRFAQYLQARNPNTPAVISKLTAESNRTRQLAQQRRWWMEVIRQSGVQCIYSCKKLTADDFALDHYVPWSFVGHDNMWNLVPVPQSVNSSKGDKLPHNQYLDALVSVQYSALATWRRHPAANGLKLLEPYVADLKLEFDDLDDKDKLRCAYKRFIPPLIDLAKANRFQANWKYKSKTPLLDG